MMVRSLAGAALVLTLVVVVLDVTLAAPSARSLHLKTDAVYFPDQVAYIRVARGKCDTEEDQVYWPGDGRCYTEGEQGPCGFEFRLVWDEQQLRPRCERDNSLFGER